MISVIFFTNLGVEKLQESHNNVLIYRTWRELAFSNLKDRIYKDQKKSLEIEMLL